MAQNNQAGTGKGDGGGGGGGGPLTQSCTFTYQPGIGNIIPGPQNLNQLPPSYQNQGYSTTTAVLRVQGGTQGASGDIMCTSYNATTQWSYVVGSESSGTGPLYTRGCCVAKWLPGDNGGPNAVNNTGGSGSDTGGTGVTSGPEGPLGLGDLFIPDNTGGNGSGSAPLNCPTQEQIYSDINGNLFYTTTVGGNEISLPQECCNRDIVGSDVVWVPQSAGQGFCRLLQNACPPIEAISIAPDQTTLLGIDNQECCNSDVTGKSNVYWDANAKLCKIPLIPIGDCSYESFTTQPVDIPERPNTEQVLGTMLGITESLNEICCTKEIVGFDVVWNPDLHICEKSSELIPGGPNTINITLNSEPIVPDNCDDLVISAKIFFTQPSELCITDSITASLLPTNPNVVVAQLGIYDSSVDGFETWVDLSARFTVPSGETFNLNLNIGGGIVRCCDYDVRVDNIRIDCYKEEERLFFDTKKCVGFDLARVIDNKRSWVYNPGLENIGESTEDNLIRERGDVGLLENFGYVNRKFAPSLDADIPWRYTDYYEQSNILEPHSKSVIISKEMELTFNMCSDCCVEYAKCPSDYTLFTTTGNTEYCTKSLTSCPSGYTLSAGTCYSGITSASTIVETITATTGSYCVKTVTLLQLEEYKKVFQSFWVRMIEQFVPATTIFVSGEKWCNNDTFICSEFDICDYDFEYVESEITVIEYGTDFVPYTGHESVNGGDAGVGETSETTLSGSTSGQPHDSNKGPILTEGTTIVPTDQDPTGGGGIVTSKNVTLTPAQMEPLLKQKREYYNNIIRGGVKEIFL